MLPFLPTFIPNLLQIAPFVVLFALACAKPLREYRGWFYLLWTVSVLAVTWTDIVTPLLGDATPAFVIAYETTLDNLQAANPMLDTLITLVTSSFTGVCLYLIVMFIGAMEKTPTVKRLLSIRSELSVIGGIIIAGHVIRIIDFPFIFATPVWAQIWGEPAGQFMFVAAVIIGPALTLVFLIPWITSFKTIRQRMPHAIWKKTQKLAYPFMALMLAQGFFLALGHCLYGLPLDTSSLMSIMGNPNAWLESFAQQVATAWLYLTLGVVYPTMRIRKHRRDKARKLVTGSSMAPKTPALTNLESTT